ncbi:MAG: type II toxin-antitoxin system Phd/YefM family antitoxin [Defluviitaleaceae bacterium]|nr:type II toxin-antitoxin system Phd/YefM family antitoxin [Defluviitaleaceae bacterium]
MEIRPITDLRNNFKEISDKVHSSNEPIYLTKNGYGDMVVMSIEAFEQFKDKQELKQRIIESETLQQQPGSKYYSHDEVFDMMKQTVKEHFNNGNSNIQREG